MGIVVSVVRQSDLFHVVGALRPSCGGAGGLHRRQQKSDKQPDNRNNHEQFDKGKPVCISPFRRNGRERKATFGHKTSCMGLVETYSLQYLNGKTWQHMQVYNYKH
jgi:hypothetical protein